MKRGWIIGIVLVAVVIGLGWRAASSPELTLEVVTPRVETIRAVIEEQATTELPTDYLVAMPIAGWLEPIGLREGDHVRKDQVVARLDTADLNDHVRQAQQRIEVLKTQIAETKDHRLEKNALVEVQATVKAINETVQAAEAKVQATKAVADFARSEVERLRHLHDEGAAADRELRQAITTSRKADADYQSDRLELAALKTLAAVSYIGPKFINDYIDRKTFDVQSYTQQVEEAQAALKIEQRNLERAELRSPIDGVVLRRHQTRRQYLTAGTPLLTLGHLDDMEVIAEVLTQQATRIAPGDPVDIIGEAMVDGPVTGKVRRVYPAGFKKISSLGVEQQRVKVAVGLDERPARLGVAFRVKVRIYYDHANDALTLPRTALFRDPRGRWQVMEVIDGRTRQRSVEVGLMNDDRVQIRSGIDADTQVVARPAREIEPGQEVAIRSIEEQ